LLASVFWPPAWLGACARGTELLRATSLRGVPAARTPHPARASAVSTPQTRYAARLARITSPPRKNSLQSRRPMGGHNTCGPTKAFRSHVFGLSDRGGRAPRPLVRSLHTPEYARPSWMVQGFPVLI